jgi:hypothetical protein
VTWTASKVPGQPPWRVLIQDPAPPLSACGVCDFAPLAAAGWAFFPNFHAYIPQVSLPGSANPAPAGLDSGPASNGGCYRRSIAEKETSLTTKNANQVRDRAEASFKKEQRAQEGIKAMADYEAEGRALRERTAKLRALRLAKEAAEQAGS